MTKAIRVLLAASLLVGTALVAGAQEVRVNVPFDFNVQGKALPAGSYTIARVFDRNPAVLVIRTTDGKAGAIFNVGQDSSKAGSSLYFSRYAESYFLRAISTTSGKYSLPVTRQERMEISRQPGSPVVVGSN